MTGVAVQQSATWSRQDQQQQQQLACYEPTSASPRHSVMDAWLRMLRLHHKEGSAYASPSRSPSPSPVCESQQKRKHPSFIKALFKPHEHKAVKNSSPQATASSDNSSSKKKPSRHTPEKSSNQALEQQQNQSQQRVVPPVEIPSMYLGRIATPGGGSSGCSVTVGGRRVPFTRDAHRRMMKKRTAKALACIAEAHALGVSNKDAYRSRAYYPAQKQRKEKR